MASAKIFRINYKSDFILTLTSDAGWMTPFCIKFWTGVPSQAYYVGWDGDTYNHCSFDPSEPTKLQVQFDDHHLPIGDLKYQVAYHFNVADFPNDTEDEVINAANITTEIDGETYQVMLDFTGETAPEIQFALPAYANEAQRIANEQQRIANEEQRIAAETVRIQNEQQRIAAEQTRQQNEQQRINQEQARVNEYATLKADAVAATGAANDAAALANQKAQLAADKAALAQAAADLANAKAQLAADKAALAASAAQLANDKAALAQQKAEYAQTQGDYAKTQGDYAKEQGDTALADHQRAEADHGIAVDDHTQAGNDHTRAESDHGIAVGDHTQAGNDHTRAESDHDIAVDDHTQAGTDHQTAAADHQTAAADHTQAGNDHTRAESDHTRAESDHAAVEVYVDSLGAFDISAYHATGGVLAKYADLTAALGTDGANIPDALRKGGMSVKYVSSSVSSSDNKYVQYRLMHTLDNASTAAADFANTANWQGVDEEPTAGSQNLAESGGVKKSLNEITKYNLLQGTQYNLTIGNVYTTLINASWYSAKIRGVAGSVFEISGKGGSAIVLWGTLDINGVCIRKSDASLDTRSNPVEVTLQDNECFIVMNTSVLDSYILLKNDAQSNNIAFENIKNLERFKNFRSTFSVWGVLASTNGRIIDSYGDKYQSTDFIKVDQRDVIDYNIYHSNSGGTTQDPLYIGGGIYCYDRNKAFIDRYTIDHAGRMMKGTVDVSSLPSNTAYIRVMQKVGDESYMYGIREDAKVDDMGNMGILIPKNGLPVYQRITSFTDINNAIGELHTIGGGVLQLGNMDIAGGISLDLNYDDVSIKGSGIHNTILRRGGNNILVFEIGDNVSHSSLSDICIVGSCKVKKTCKLMLTNCLMRDEMYNGLAPSEYYIASSDSPNGPRSAGYDVIDVSENAASTINTALSNYDTVFLVYGTYNITSAISLNSGNKIKPYLSTQGSRISINRSTNGYCIMTKDNSINTYVERCSCNRGIALTRGNSHNGEIFDCVVEGGKVISHVCVGKAGVNDIDCMANGVNFSNALYFSRLEVPNDVKNRICVYGVVEETISSTIQVLGTTWIVGMSDNAEIRITNNNPVNAIMFRDYNGIENHSIVENVILSMYGTAGSYQYAVVNIRSNYCYFENCQFINRQNCSSAYDPEVDTGNSPLSGDRKHGCLIVIDEDTNVYDDNCHLELHNCMAEGSPYGNKNCRGFYIMKGSPKLYNCKGIGGGVGRYGYGIVCHHSSKPYLYNCIGIGSPYGWELANGIQFQMSSEAKLFNCIGFGGTGYKYKSSGNGVITKQNEITGASHGFGFLMNVKPTLVNCMGYAGDGEGSFGLYANYLSKPEIVGGVFGKDVKMYCIPFTKDSGEDYMTLSIGNDYRDIELVSVGFRDLTGMTSGQKIVFKNGNGDIILEASEITQQQYATISDKYITANDTITCRVIDGNGDDVTSTVNFNIIVQYMVSNSMSCVGMELTASPHVHKALLKGNDEADGISIETTTNDYLIEGCTVEVAATRYPVKSSTQRSNVNVVGCLFTSALDDENILSYATVIQKGSNSVVS